MAPTDPRLIWTIRLRGTTSAAPSTGSRRQIGGVFKQRHGEAKPTPWRADASTHPPSRIASCGRLETTTRSRRRVRECVAVVLESAHRFHAIDRPPSDAPPAWAVLPIPKYLRPRKQAQRDDWPRRRSSTVLGLGGITHQAATRPRWMRRRRSWSDRCGQAQQPGHRPPGDGSTVGSAPQCGPAGSAMAEVLRRLSG